ncbi:TonB-dependent receptor [Wenyingzhuangia aestuarii]|uniref:TonB-dependent receptor n=1 Tax=Wenyingzhuangia aestuarii TaxID=1647582 RepID=UPI00143C9386|nr:TonB-dependent receptor plug domain-containing protein [Wenyingzhuangia aestuarii]NJB82008.1 outer membrane receptor protein involved in Fe transport [Wenyingzhuangia aestuarii]
MKKILFFILFVSCVAIAQRKHHKHHGKHQILVGTIANNNGEPLMGATILVDDNKYATIANDKGEYFIHNISEGKHIVQASYLGFSPEKKEIFVSKDPKSQKINCHFSLKESSESLQKVELSAKSQKTEIETKGFAVNVVETKEASLRNVQTNELLNTTVGVKIRQNGGLGSNVEYSLNGLSGNSVRIFIDGIPISMYGSSFSLNSIPPSMIENIEIYKGVVPGHLADDALGGAINIVMKKGAKSNLNASISYGSFNTFQSSVNGLYRFDKSGFTIKASAFYNYSANDYKVWGRGVVDIAPNGRTTEITATMFNNAYESVGGVAQVGFTDVKWADQFLVGFTGSYDYKEIPNGAFMSTLPYKGRFMESDSKLATLTYLKKDLFTKGLNVNINGLYGKRNRVVNDTVPWIYTWKGERLKDLNNNDIQYNWGSQQEKSEYGPILNYIDRNVSSIRTGVSYEINKQHKVLLNHVYSGIDREDHDEYSSALANTFTETKDLYKNIYSLSYELNAFDEKLKLNLFGKHYHQKVLNTNPVFNEKKTEVIEEIYKSKKKYNGYGFATSYVLFPNITLITSAEKAVRLPDETEIFGNTGDNVDGNLTLKPEISYNYNLGVRFGKLHIKKHALTLSTNLFSRNIQDLISLPINSEQLNQDDEVISYVNLEKSSTSKGIDLDVNYSYNNNFGINFNLSRLNLTTTVNNLEVDVPNTPKFTMNAGTRYSIKNFIQKNSRLNLFYSIYFTDEFSYIQSQESGVRDDTNFSDVPLQLVQDLGLSYAFPKERFVLSFDAKNIFNKTAYDNLSIQKPGRSFYLKLNYTINKF